MNTQPRTKVPDYPSRLKPIMDAFPERDGFDTEGEFLTSLLPRGVKPQSVNGYPTLQQVLDLR